MRSYKSYFGMTLKGIQKITLGLQITIMYRNSAKFFKNKKFGQKNQR